MVWIRTIEEIPLDSTKVSSVLCSAFPLGILYFFVLPLRRKHCMLLHLSAQQLPALWERSCCIALYWAHLEKNYSAFFTKDWIPWDCDLCMHVCVYTYKEKAEERKMNGRVFLLIAPAPSCWKNCTWRDASALGDCTRILMGTTWSLCCPL